uniref:Putative secreted protein n=1 Tax=Amblyomma cajennense TaxID=34607 RepID=A0A023FBL9_AMBCJ
MSEHTCCVVSLLVLLSFFENCQALFFLLPFCWNNAVNIFMKYFFQAVLYRIICRTVQHKLHGEVGLKDMVNDERWYCTRFNLPWQCLCTSRSSVWLCTE